VLVLLPPSEAKAPGGDGPPLDLATLSWPSLTPTRERLLAALAALSTDPEASWAAPGLGGTAHAEVAANAALRTAPTTPALERYSGVPVRRESVATLDPQARGQAERAVVVASALFGAVRGGDRLPAYRLSAGSRLPGLDGLPALWRPMLAGALDPVLEAEPGVVVDLRSSAYAALWRPPRRLAARLLPVRVLSEAPDGSRSVVSHVNKAAKGRLARALLENPGLGATLARDGVEQVAAAARTAGLRVERSPAGLDLVEARVPGVTGRAAPGRTAGRR
jgi:cytoplasmic iron level regulating protein YaaA (DUF328/UPF0246 family)